MPTYASPFPQTTPPVAATEARRSFTRLMTSPAERNTTGNEVHQGALASSGNSNKEAFFGLVCGAAYGVTSVLVGQPFDTVKTRMQVLNVPSASSVIKSVVHRSGLRGLYSGMLPVLIGSTVFRSAQFTGYGWGFSKSQEVFASTSEPISYTNGLRPAVLIGSLCAGTLRALIECPVEVCKIRSQLNLSPTTFILRDAYHGFFSMWIRSTGLLTTALIGFDYAIRLYPETMGKPVTGDFLKGSVIATLAWFVIWPSEALKNHVQAGNDKMSIVARARLLLREQGFRGFYRGILPGLTRSVFANGLSMVAFMGCQRLR